MPDLELIHSEELADVKKYESLADKCDEKYRGIFLDIAAEEKVHAQHIKDIIDDMKRQ